MVVLCEIEIFTQSFLRRALLSGGSGIVRNKDADTAASEEILLSQGNIPWRNHTPATTIRKLFPRHQLSSTRTDGQHINRIPLREKGLPRVDQLTLSTL